MDTRMLERKKHLRDDGFLVELFSLKYGDFEAVHSYLVSIEPEKTRAGHFHKKKTEVIYPVDGKVRVLLVEDGNKKEVFLDSESKKYGGLLIAPNIAHFLKNTSSSRAKVIVFSDSFDLEDTYPVKVEE
jgi:dTDP-4-dehydrorhamnose 3,5-epimerase-like enzyme